MNEEEKNLKEKVVLFPGVVEKLVTKGMEALKEKQFKDALVFFEQALKIEPDNPQGRFGVALSLIEQSRLEEAKVVTEKMLKEDIGNYFDILQVHLSLLVQLGNYDEVVTMLEGIIAEEKLPANLAESFYHLLHFSRQMIDDGTKIEVEKDQKLPEELLEMLYHGSPEKQWLAIQMLGRMSCHLFVDSVREFLISEKNDPVLKSIVLQQLKEKNIKETVEVHKFGQLINIYIPDLEDVFHERFGKNTLELVSRELENENPTLYEMVSQLWWHFLFALYPITPEPLTPPLWAAAIHFIGCQFAGMEVDELELANKYKVNLEEMLACAKHIEQIESRTFKY